jgi:3-phenylpropionate/cinnamic acid dioxygenase small subunit
MSAMSTLAEDHAEIRNLLSRYCLLLDHDDVEGWLGLFTPDATFAVYGRTFVGHDGLRRMLSGAPGGLHLGGAVAIDVVGDGGATAQQNLLFIDRTNGEFRSAVYDDELVRTDVGWRIKARRCRFIVADGLSDRPE